MRKPKHNKLKSRGLAEGGRAKPGMLRAGFSENTRFFHQLRILAGAFWQSHTRNSLIATSFGILLLIIMIAHGQLAILDWTKNFWNAIDRKDLSEFIYQLGVFFVIAGILLVFNVMQTFLNQYLKLKLREGLTDDLIDQWMRPKRAFRLTMAGEIGVNPDQRLHEDARHLAESTADLGVNLLQATIILITFIPSLWATSTGFVFNFAGYSFPLPGYMVWAVILYVSSASLLTWYVGRDLVKINATRYAREADLRASLMRTNRSIQIISPMQGEKVEFEYIGHRVQRVLDAIWEIVVATTKLTGITAGYGWVSNVAPYIIAAPIYFGGGIDLGGMQAAVQAFNQTNTSLRWFVDNYGALADWRATMLRIASFRQAILGMDNADCAQSTRKKHSAFIADETELIGEQRISGYFGFDKLVIFTPTGHIVPSTSTLKLTEHQKLLLYCPQDVDKTIVFQALTGFWPWGQGMINRPDDIVYLPEMIYLPAATLRQILYYPLLDYDFTDDAVYEALSLVGLDGYIKDLDDDAIDWDRRLNDGDRRCLAFARLKLRKPKWIVANQIMDGVDDEIKTRLSHLIGNKMQDSAFIYLSRRDDEMGLFTEKISFSFEPVLTT